MVGTQTNGGSVDKMQSLRQKKKSNCKRMSREKQCDREQVVILTKAPFLFATSTFTNSDLKAGKSSMSLISLIKKT